MESAFRFPRYDSYKASGADWLGEVPTDWSVASIRAVTQLKSKKNQPDLQVLSVYRDYGVILKDSREDNHNATSLDTSGYKVVNEGDLVVNKMKAWQGSMGVSEHMGIVSPAYITCRVDAKRVYPKFLHYLLRSKPYIGVYNALSYGVRVGQWDMHYEDFKHIPLPLPDREQQQRIANFLDQKTAEIDEAIAKKQRLIELLKEQKVILINQAVTKGLNPGAPMRDSGVEWMGEVPMHWEIKRLKYVLDERNERSKTGNEPLFMVSQVHGLVVRSEYHEKAEVAQSNIDNKIVYKNDLIFNKLKAHLGVFFKSNIEFQGLVSPDYAVYKPKGVIHDMKYLECLFRHPTYIGQFIIRATGIVEGLIRLYTGDLFDIPVPVPPSNEQDAIILYIQDTSAKYDKAIALQRQQVDKLNEYKAIMISNAVSGKIKVA